MKNHMRRILYLSLVVLMMTLGSSTVANAASADPTSKSGTHQTECSVCEGTGICMSCYGLDKNCPVCSGTNICPECEGTGFVDSPSHFFNSIWALLPPVLAIALALITKEVYSSLFAGILVGALLYSNFSFEGTLEHFLQGGIMHVLSDSYNVGILIFLVVLGSIVCLMNKSGGSAAFGRWAETHIKTRVGAELATICLGCLIFIDDYFNCLTVGSVMRPITDKHKVSRAKLSYLIDSTAAPVCIIAPISSWAAAVAAFAEDGEGLNLFIRAIPFNFYALLTLVMIIGLVVTQSDFGKMRKYELNAEHGDIFSGHNPYADMEKEMVNNKGLVRDLVIPILVLVFCCVFGMIHSGDFFNPASENYLNFVKAFAASDASVGLAGGSIVALLFAMIYFLCRRTIHFTNIMESVPEGFKAMIPAIMILTFAWTLKAMTDSLGATYFVRDIVRSSASGMQLMMPAIVFVVGCLLAFATGTSWGTFGMLIPIVLGVFPMDHPMAIICISACMSGAVCGDHCSPISDTTIMASAGAECDHVDHVTTQLPYAVTAACISLFGYILTGVFVQFELPPILALPVVVTITVLTVLFIHRHVSGKSSITKTTQKTSCL